MSSHRNHVSTSGQYRRMFRTVIFWCSRRSASGDFPSSSLSKRSLSSRSLSLSPLLALSLSSSESFCLFLSLPLVDPLFLLLLMSVSLPATSSSSSSPSHHLLIYSSSHIFIFLFQYPSLTKIQPVSAALYPICSSKISWGTERLSTYVQYILCSIRASVKCSHIPCIIRFSTSCKYFYPSWNEQIQVPKDSLLLQQRMLLSFGLSNVKCKVF